MFCQKERFRKFDTVLLYFFRCVAWHPHVAKVALAMKDDTVQVVLTSSAIKPLLKHKKQKQVRKVPLKMGNLLENLKFDKTVPKDKRVNSKAAMLYSLSKTLVLEAIMKVIK